MVRRNRGSAPSASLGEGTLVGLRYADMVEPVERHVGVSGGIQEQAVVCSLAGEELRVSWREMSCFAVRGRSVVQGGRCARRWTN
jgi:hypothetical protein